MAIATLTTKGQVTIPKIIRESLKLHSGDKIEIIITEDQKAIIRPLSKKVDDLYCKLHKSEQNKFSLEDIDKAVSNRMKDKFK